MILKIIVLVIMIYQQNLNDFMLIIKILYIFMIKISKKLISKL